MKSSRKPTPVPVVYFPKKSATRSRTQTLPELFLGEESKTEELDLSEGRRKRRSKSGSFARTTLSDETPDPHQQAQARFDMAALGHELFSRGKIAEAKVIFEGLAADAARFADGFVFTMLGTIHLAQNELEKAATRFEEALKIDADDLAALVYRAEIRLQKRRVRQAVEDLQRAVELGAPNEPFVERAKRLLQLAKRTVKR